MTDNTDRKPQLTKDDWPNLVHTREELDARLKVGRESGTSPLSIPEIVAREKAKLQPSG